MNMDLVERAIANKKTITNHKFMHEQIWSKFEEIADDKEIIMYGVGAIAPYFWFRSKNKERLKHIVDSNKDMQGYNVGKFLFWNPKDSCDMLIENPEIISRTKDEEVVIIINSINYFDEIADELENKGYHNVFSLLLLEASLRERSHLEWIDCDRLDFIKRCTTYPIEDKILFIGFGTYSDHGKYITEKLINNSNNHEIVWAVKDDSDEIPKSVRTIYIRNWRAFLYEIETSKIIIYSTVLPKDIIKRNNQIHIHTKHWASITLKKFYLDATTIIDNTEDVAHWKKCFGELDYVFTGSEFDDESVKRGFSKHVNCIRIGSPRTDAMFLRDELRRKVCKKLQISDEKKLLLYAPTYRYKKGRYKAEHLPERRGTDLDYDVILKALGKKTKNEWIILLRLHPSIANSVFTNETNNKVINVSDYEDGEELCAACDAMISDYSSIMFEPAFIGTPVFLYACDKEDYIDNEYDLLINYEQLPFSNATSNEELVRDIENFDLDSYREKVSGYLKGYGVSEDGHASERAAEFIRRLL